MPEKYEIEISDRAAYVIVEQYDADGNVVVLQNISCPIRAVEQRDEAEQAGAPNFRVRMTCKGCKHDRDVWFTAETPCPNCRCAEFDVKQL
jgi:hypothetical protein